MGFNPLSILKSVAPMLINALPFGGIVGNIAKDVINKNFGTDHKTPEDAIKALQNPSADDIVKIKQCEADITLRLKELGINEVHDLAVLQAQDRDSARNREIQVRDKMPAIMSLLAVIIFVVSVVVLFLHVIPPDNKDTLIMLIGAEVVILKDAYGYYLGSSFGSSKKDDTISELSK